MNRQTKKLSLFSLLIILALAACNSDEDGSGSLSSRQLLKQEPFATLTDSINQFPNSADLRLRRAILLSQGNYHEMATDDYREAWKLTGDENIALEYASNLFLSGDADDAIEFLEECTERFPQNTEFGRRLAEAYSQTGNRRRALDQYDQILEQDPDNFETWYEKGLLLLRNQDTASAVYAMERSFSLMPISYSGLALANLYASMKDDRALEICDILIARDSSEVLTDALFMKGIFHLETKQYPKALGYFEECIRRDWKLIDAHLHKGIVQYEMKNYKTALETFRLAATVSNTVPDSYYWMARCQEELGERENAIINYERAISLDQEGSFEEARTRLRRIRQAD